MSVPLAIGDRASVPQPVVHELEGDLEKGPIQPVEEKKVHEIDGVHELPTHSTSSRGSRLFTSLNLRDSRIRSYCPGLTEEELAREKINKFVGYKRFENTRRYGILPMSEAALLRPKTAPAEPLMSKNEEARQKVREFVDRRPSSRKGPVDVEAHQRSESESTVESTLEKMPKEFVEG